jgi:hypothetical protein
MGFPINIEQNFNALSHTHWLLHTFCCIMWARPDTQGMMAVYLTKGGMSNRLLGLSCHHVLIGPTKANIDYIHQPNRPPRDVLLLGRRAFTDLSNSIKHRIELHAYAVKHWRKEIKGYEKREKDMGTKAADAEKAKVAWIETQQ